MECMMRIVIVLLPALVFICSACQRTNPVCPPDSITYVDEFPSPNLNLEIEPLAAPVDINIGRKLITVDRVVDGPLCNDSWSGTVYVACELQISAWEENPTFLEACDLKIEPGTVVYVAAHNDTPYYKGCSCHTGEDPIP